MIKTTNKKCTKLQFVVSKNKALSESRKKVNKIIQHVLINKYSNSTGGGRPGDKCGGRIREAKSE
jgi:hypothetical protein